WVEELYVRPAFRGRGLGHEFFAWLRGLAAAEHIRRIRLETEPENERAAALYARMGFLPLGYCQMFREEAT
ncbi:MAG: GNAT family N-acetyltransferase, partial [Oscillospiraceae bacterium]